MTEIVMMGVTGMILLRGIMTRTDVYAAFLRGAQRGIRCALRMAPPLSAMLLMLHMLNASGVTEVLTRLAAPVMRGLGVAEGVTPMLLLRPLTGSGSMAALQEIFRIYGADSQAGRLASAVMCSSETIFYTLTVYAGAAGVRRLPGVVAASLMGYLASLLTCIWLIR